MPGPQTQDSGQGGEGQGRMRPGSQEARGPRRQGARRPGGQGASQLGHQSASKTRTFSTKVRRKRVPLGRKSISNRVRWRVEGSKSCTLTQKVHQKRVPLSRKSTSEPQGGVKNAYPYAKSASKTRTLRQKVAPSRFQGPPGFEENTSFVILDEFSRAFGDLLDRTP